MGFLSELLDDVFESSDSPCGGTLGESDGLTFDDSELNIPMEWISKVDTGVDTIDVTLYTGLSIRLDNRGMMTSIFGDEEFDTSEICSADSFMKLGCPTGGDVNSLTEDEAREALEKAKQELDLYLELISLGNVLRVDASWSILRLHNLAAWYGDHKKRSGKDFARQILAVALQWKEKYVDILTENCLSAGDEVDSAIYLLELIRFRLDAYDKGEHSFVRYQRFKAAFLNMDVEQEDLVSQLCDNLRALSDDSSAKFRKVLVCDASKRSSLEYRNVKPGTLLCTADDIEYANSHFNAGLIFQPGHPQNGCTYIQHPLRNKLYFEVNSFHDALRERKQNELLRILESLGAFSARVEVRHSQSLKCDSSQNSDVGATGSYGVFSASGQHKTGSERSEQSLQSQSLTKEWTFNPPEVPKIPDDLVFYPSEETWQQLASSVLRGGLKHAVVDLEYKTEYGVTEKFLNDISASTRAIVPSYEMNLKKEFASELQQLETTQWHYDVSFEDGKGHRAGKGNAEVVLEDASNRAEQLFLKRARRYAQSDGHINAEQRTDLELFAQKYGIDDLRMEELIEEAFG